MHIKCHYIILQRHTRSTRMTAVQMEQGKKNHTFNDTKQFNKPYQNRVHEILTKVTAATTEIVTEYMSE